MFFSVCLPSVLGGTHVREALRAVRDAGFTHYEFWHWWDTDMNAYAQAQRETGLSPAGFCAPFRPLTDPACRTEFLDGLRQTLDICDLLGCRTVITQVGQALPGVPRGKQHDSIVEGLKACAPLLSGKNVTLAIEPLNTRVDHRGYYLWSMAEALDIVGEVAHPQVKVLCDLYHQYVMDDLNLKQIIGSIDSIAHFHVAGFPGRHEPFENSEVDYPHILAAIRESGYAHGVGMEYFPVRDGASELKDLFALLSAL